MADPDVSRPAHCEHLADTITDVVLCDAPRTATTTVMSTRAFVFGIRHPALEGMLCGRCIEALGRYIRGY